MSQLGMINEIWLVSPLLILTAGAVAVLLIDVFLQRAWPGGLFTGFVLVAAMYTSNYLFLGEKFLPGQRIFHNLLYADRLSAFALGLFLCASIFVVLLAHEKLKQEKVEAAGEYYSLLLMTTIGAIIFASAGELITMFLGLETMSMALYCLCGSALTVRASSESALKYFLLGSFSSAFMLYGIALLYGLTGTTLIPELAAKLAGMDSTVLYIAIGLVLIGFLFKISAVPFHFWAPDVYQGAPTTITAYMATVIKASAVIALLRFIWGAVPGQAASWTGAMWTLAVITMTVGNLIALRQRSVKRMLAYSSIAHAGYMMVAMQVDPVLQGGGAAILYYLVAYTAMSLGAFAVVLVVASANPGEPDADEITRFNALAQSRPFLAATMALFMLGLAGIPPGMAGLLGKFYIFSSAVQAGFVGLAIIGVLNSAISAYYYLRVIVAMYFIEPQGDEVVEKPELGVGIAGILALCSIGVVALGVFPSALHDSARVTVQSFVNPTSLEITVEQMKAQPRPEFNLSLP
ncbi:MAG: NADH-quinone oxidoreductase subunit N [Deltaproteobacteria bacterium]|nr:NADH-quinone oxidoreductase subunit N [Deltaproteobacteria bacterium]